MAETTSNTNEDDIHPDSDYDELFGLSDYEENNIDSDQPDTSLSYLPFTYLHAPTVKFKTTPRDVFIPGTDIFVKIVNFDRSLTTHPLNPNLYTIDITHGAFAWTIRKRYKHFQALHQQLKLFRTSLNIPFPTRAHRDRRTSFKQERNANRDKRHLPRFPSKPEALVPYDSVEQRAQQLEEYLNNMLRIKLFRTHQETVMFLEVSQLSFVEGLGPKFREGMILKRTGSKEPGRAGCNFCGLLDSTICVRCNYTLGDMCGGWRQRWLIIRDTWMGYLRPKDGQLGAVLLYDQNFEVSSGMYSTGLRHGLRVSNSARQLIIKCWTRRRRKEWVQAIKESTLMPAALELTRRNRFGTLTPPRADSFARWLVDGAEYMSAVADAIESAREEIFIADWWLSPEIYLRRPVVNDDTWRLDKVLQRKANEGVKIYVLIYKEVQFALGINSFYSKQVLVSLHPNIRVLRHPDHAKSAVFFWAHHEKIVVIDQSVALLGGIDLCYGRWDDFKHRLTDLGSTVTSLTPYLPAQHKITSSTQRTHAKNQLPQSLFQLALATNKVGVGVVSSVAPNMNSSEIPEESTKQDTPPPERRSRQILDSLRDRTENAKAKGRAAIKNWFYSNASDGEEADDEYENRGTASDDEIEKIKEFNINKRKTFNKDDEFKPSTEQLISKERDYDSIKKDVRNEETINAAANLSSDSEVEIDQNLAKLWLGKDYTNFIVKDFDNLSKPYDDLVNRSTTPRMPWHDVGLQVRGAIAQDVARHFIQRWNAIKLEKAHRTTLYPYLIPKSYDSLPSSSTSVSLNGIRVTAQLLRSASSWSVGLSDSEFWEESIHEAYLDAIAKSEHYIFIENQFYITSNIQVKNQIGDAVAKRIIRAFKEEKEFRVYIILPLLPGFEGEVGGTTGTALHAITHWNYASICRGRDSLLERLQAAGITEPENYVTFHGLRNHAVLNGDLISELIYVHSKLLIVDDRLVICGSANINDRSMIGKRDSEVALLIEDQEFENGTMNGEPHKRGKYAGGLRRRLFAEHLGLLGKPRSLKTSNLTKEHLEDPVSASFYLHVWRSLSLNNTNIFEKVFKVIPSDKVTNFNSLRLYQQEPPLSRTDPTEASRLLESVQGHLVMLPLQFLSEEDLIPKSGTVEGMMPISLWT